MILQRFGLHLRRLVLYVLCPTIFYGGAFILLTYPRVQTFSTHLHADNRDGFQNVWNLWWVNKAVTGLHQSPWYTTYLHYPSGMSLYLHTLSPFNGLLAIPILRYLSLTQTYNVLIVVGFVMSGVTAFWLAYTLTRSYAGGLLAGYVFTFSEFHFAHAQSHLNLVSLEWLPVFVLTLYRLVTRPGAWIAIAAALSLFALILSDYYYFFYGVITGLLLLAWFGCTHRDRTFWLERSRIVAAASFVAISFVTTAPLLAGLVSASRHDVFAGAHMPAQYSLDLPGPLIPGEAWRFSEITRRYWARFPPIEASGFLGYVTIWAVVSVWRNRRTTRLPDVGFWYLMMLVFAILALGPRLHIAGREVPLVRLPYALLERLPIIKLSGVPVRAIVMVTLAGSLCVAEAFRLFFQSGRSPRTALAVALAVVVVVERLPRALPATQTALPGVVAFLRDQPGDDGYFDATVEPLEESRGMYDQMYDQTIHQKPIAYGITSRITTDAIAHDQELQRLASVGDFGTLRCKYGFKWLLSDRVTNQKVVWIAPRGPADAPAYLYELDQRCDAADR